MKKAFPISDWGYIGDIDSEGRKIANFVIGEETEEEGDPKYITEPIFVDLANELQAKREGFTATVNINSVPPFVIQYNKNVLLHNHDMQNYIEHIKNALEDIPTDYIMQYLIESRQLGYEKKKSAGVKTLESMIRSKTGVNYHSVLIMCMIRQMIYEMGESEPDIGEIFKKMTSPEIYEFIGAVIEYMMTEETSNEYLAELLNSYSIEEIEKAMNRDITYKYFLGILN